MKRVLVMLIAGTVASGVAAAFACMSTPTEAATADAAAELASTHID